MCFFTQFDTYPNFIVCVLISQFAFVEVKKIMTPRPKEIIQWVNPMTSNHERDKITTKKKRMVSAKDLKPKIHGRKSLAYQDQGIKASPTERAGPGSLETGKGLGPLGHTAQLR